MGFLTPSELKKYDWRIPLLLKKLEEGSIFVHRHGETPLECEGDFTVDNLSAVRLRTPTGLVIRTSDIVKTSEFGGKTLDVVMKRENSVLMSIEKQIDDTLQYYGRKSLPLDIEGQVYHISRVEKTIGTPKSDFHLLDEAGEPCVWISHKHGSRPTDFQQYSGISERCEPNIYHHPETQKFVGDFKSRVGSELAKGTTISRPIESGHLKNLAVFGNDYGSALGENNVTLIAQGELKLVSNNNTFNFLSTNYHPNGHVPEAEFAPSFFASYRLQRNSVNVKNARLNISSRDAKHVTEFI